MSSIDGDSNLSHSYQNWQIYEASLEIELTRLINEYTKEKLIMNKSKLLIFHINELDNIIQKVEELCQTMKQVAEKLVRMVTSLTATTTNVIQESEIVADIQSHSNMMTKPDFKRVVNNILQQTFLEISAAQNVCLHVRLQTSLEQTEALTILACFRYKPYDVQTLGELITTTKS